jgi:hypothetical protein
LGQKIACCAKFRGKLSPGKALLESNEIIFHGDFRLKIPFASIMEIKTQDGQLHVKTAEGIAVFELRDRAEKWRDKIQNPKSVIDKLGVKARDTVRLLGTFDKQFHQTLRNRRAKIVEHDGASWIFFEAQDRAQLCQVKSIVSRLKGTSALWMVYPKGQKGITERDVRETALRHGLKDVKVVGFSDTHTALKFVRPKGSN